MFRKIHVKLKVLAVPLQKGWKENGNIIAFICFGTLTVKYILRWNEEKHLDLVVYGIASIVFLIRHIKYKRGYRD